MVNKSTIKRALEVQDMVARYYEPGRQDRCKLWVYRNHVFPVYNISKGTFFRYLRMDRSMN
jgi:hypothetical protein